MAETDRIADSGDLFEPLAKLKKFKKYWVTRVAVLEGRELHNLSKKQLEEAGYLSSWEFNVVQSLLSALPGTLLPPVLNLFRLVPVKPTDPTSDAIKILLPFVAPFSLLLTAYCVA